MNLDWGILSAAAATSGSASRHEPSAVEQNHIDQALRASDTAISAIDTILNISMWTLAILAILLAVIGIVGWGVIRSACGSIAKQIANKRFDAYIETDEFRGLVEDRIAQSVKERWQNAVVVTMLQEDKPEAGDRSPFPKEPNEGAGI